VGSSYSLRCERVNGVNLEGSEVTNVARHNHQMVHDRSGGDQRILEEMIRLPVHEFRADPEDAGIDRKDVPGLGHLIDPDLDFGSLLLIAFTSDFDTGLQFS